MYIEIYRYCLNTRAAIRRLRHNPRKLEGWPLATNGSQAIKHLRGNPRKLEGWPLATNVYCGKQLRLCALAAGLMHMHVFRHSTPKAARIRIHARLATIRLPTNPLAHPRHQPWASSSRKPKHMRTCPRAAMNTLIASSILTSTTLEAAHPVAAPSVRPGSSALELFSLLWDPTITLFGF